MECMKLEQKTEGGYNDGLMDELRAHLRSTRDVAKKRQRRMTVKPLDEKVLKTSRSAIRMQILVLHRKALGFLLEWPELLEDTWVRNLVQWELATFAPLLGLQTNADSEKKSGTTDATPGQRHSIANSAADKMRILRRGRASLTPRTSRPWIHIDKPPTNRRHLSGVTPRAESRCKRLQRV
jgi:hypothetical protein